MLPKEHAIDLARQCLKQISSIPESAKVSIIEDAQARRKKTLISQMCRLWAGMGSIYLVEIQDALKFAVKHVTPPPSKQQSLGDERKAFSYQVEANFYQHVAPELLLIGLVLPTPYYVQYGPAEQEITICMSLLEGSWIQSDEDWQGTLQWLAQFHAAYWGRERIDPLLQKVKLQAVASYWHLETRPDEHSRMSNRGWEGRLKRAAKAIDDCLKRDPMQCLVHGDPKEANIMKLKQQQKVALYDFQYCGKGTPTRDLAYFLCTSCDEDIEDDAVQYYHEQLTAQLTKQGMVPPTLEHLEQSLELAFCDFHRFLCGWGQWGYNLKDKVLLLLERIDGGKDLGSEEAYQEAFRKEFW